MTKKRIIALCYSFQIKVFTDSLLKSELQISVESRKVKKQWSFEEFIKHVNQSVPSKSVFDSVDKLQGKKILMRRKSGRREFQKKFG